MPSLDTHNWNFTSLIGAFLNLSIAYLLLCTSLLIHLILRFLEFLGLSLPRFHNGRFIDCLQGDLVDHASERISDVDRSIKTKIPFRSITQEDDDSNRFLKLKLVRKNSGDISNARFKYETKNNVINNKLDGFDSMNVHHGMKGKRFATRKSRNGLKNHRRGRASFGSLRSISSSEAFDETLKSHSLPPFDERFSNDEYTDGEKAIEKISLSHWSEIEKNVSVNEHVNSNSSNEQSLVIYEEKNSIKALEESLEKERAARAAVCIELDKERSAAASAADEAMAMIHRLQDEKATIEMEAMQFKRMVEEKSIFDAEEMIILKDILIRREREKHFLEKEVEAYRELFIETDELEQTLNVPETESIQKIAKMVHKQNQESQEKRALLVQEVDGTVFDMPYREEITRDRSRDLYKSDSEVVYSRVRDVYMVKDDEKENIVQKKKNQEETFVSKPQESLQDNSINVTGIARKLPPLCRPRRKSLSSSGSRRKSMSAVDYERLKIENEVELLRERLKVVQKEREQLTRRASLPPLSSKVKVTSEKRGWRRSSMDQHSS